jgi:hypothetical protein
MLRIRIGFSADPDQAFYLNADQDPRSQTNADPDSGQALPSLKNGFSNKKFIFYRQYVKTDTYVGTKSILIGWKSGLFVILVNFLAP